MRTRCTLLSLFICASLWAGYREPPQDSEFPPPWTRPALIQIGLVVDTGTHASGLIRQVQADLYDVINELLLSEKNGEQAIVQIAVVSASNNDVQILTPLTSHYDAVISQLEHLHPGHGKTPIGQTLATALNALEWSPYSQDIKRLFVVGPGRLRRSTDDFLKSGVLEAEKDVMIHTLYAGAYKQGVHDGWAEMAYCTGGQYMAIKSVMNSNNRTGLDAVLNKAKKELIDTYRQQGDPWKHQWEVYQDMSRDSALISMETALQQAITWALKSYNPDYLKSLHLEGLDDMELNRQVEQTTQLSLDTVQAVTDFEEQRHTRQQVYEEIVLLARQRRTALTPKIFSSKTPGLAFGMIQILHKDLEQRGFEMPPGY